jgi:hypothetical protein
MLVLGDQILMSGSSQGYANHPAGFSFERAMGTSIP